MRPIQVGKARAAHQSPAGHDQAMRSPPALKLGPLTVLTYLMSGGCTLICKHGSESEVAKASS